MDTPDSSTSTLTLSSRYCRPIRTIDDWRDRRKALNTGWEEGRSAWETAYAWVGNGSPSVPEEISSLLDSNEMTRGTTLERGIVEAKTYLQYSGGPRNHDVLLFGQNPRGGVVVGIESKADDGLGDTMQDQVEQAKALRQKKNTNLDLRADWLSRSILDSALIGPAGKVLQTPVLKLPYQLFAGVAGTMFEAVEMQGNRIAVFLVHQFRTKFTIEEAINEDARSLERFLRLLIQANETQDLESQLPLQYGSLVGPIHFKPRDCGKERWNMPTDIPLFVGKVLTDRI